MERLRWRQIGSEALFALALVGCATLPKHIDRPESNAILDARHTPLARLIGPPAARHPGKSGFRLYNTGASALRARVALAVLAESSIDAQYFYWAGDATGRAVLQAVLAAADRGVRVRLLLDDYTAKGHDIAFEALDAHPNIEVRIFNPFVRGRLRLPQFLGRFSELNHRMHNKCFIVDGRALIIGGRNLADEYFGLGDKLDFRDFDLLGIGPVVSQAAAGFDLYWNSQWAYPISALRRRSSSADLQRARARFAAHLVTDRSTYPYRLPGNPDAAASWLMQAGGEAIWAPAEVVYDDPSLVAKPLHGELTHVAKTLVTLTRQAQHDIVVENAYLVPHKEMAYLRALRDRGVRLWLLTNSLASTDVVAVNAAYSKSRHKLAELGVALYEMKPYAASRPLYVARPKSSHAHLALHGKAAVFDRRTVFLGSFNLDPRSASLDTEGALVIHSSELAARLLATFAIDFAPANAWHIGSVVGKDGVAWMTEWPGRTDIEPHEPATWWRRMRRSFSGLLPLSKYL